MLGKHLHYSLTGEAGRNSQLLKKLPEMKLTANKQSVVHKPGHYHKVSAVKTLVESNKLVKRISEIARLTIDVDNNMLICDACSTTQVLR